MRTSELVREASSSSSEDQFSSNHVRNVIQ